MSFLEKNKVPLAIVFSGIIIALAIYFGLKGEKNLKTNINKNKETSLSQSQSLSPTKVSNENLTPTVASIPTNIINLTPTVSIPNLNEEQIKQGLLSKTIIPAEKLEYSIGERLDRENKILIRGAVKNKEEEHGAGFFAYCDFQKCEVTFVGQEVPKCSEVNPYGYPLDWADYCVDNKGEIVKR